MKRYVVYPRGLGSDLTPGCYCCGGKDDLYSNISFFVESREDGTEIVNLLSQGARLDYRDHEPSWIQVKVGACDVHLANLERLLLLIYSTEHEDQLERFCYIDKEIIEASKT